MLEKIYHKMNIVNRISEKFNLTKLNKIKGIIYYSFSIYANNKYKTYLKHAKIVKLKSFDNSNFLFEKEIIVSLTSFPTRIDTVWITIETLLRQTLQPDRIILWLADSEFENKLESLPKNLLNLRERGLEIKFCEDLKPHKKYYYSMLKYPDDVIITVDDDVLYPSSLVKDLVALYVKFPNCISCTRGHLMTLDTDNNISKYSDWIFNPSIEEKPSKYIIPTGVGGVLYPPNSLTQEVFYKKEIKNLSLNADDLWLKVMSLRKGTYVIKSNKYEYNFLAISNKIKHSLSDTNVKENQNDIQLNLIIDEFSVNFD